MTQVFLKPGFEKTTKNQLKFKVPEGLVFSGNGVVGDVSEVRPFDLFTEKLNPLTDFCRENYKNIEVVRFDESSDVVKVLDFTKPKHYIVLVKAGVSAAVVFDGENNCLASAEVYVAGNAQLKAVLLQLSNQSFNFSALRARVEKDAKIDWYLNYFKVSNAYSFVQSHLVGERAESNMHLVSSSENSEVSDFFVGNCFDAPNCKGQILARGVSKDRSRMSFVGEIDITLQGGGTDSYLKEDVLMLDATSKIDAVPSLEIKTNDVKAGHGVSISRLNDDKLFYLTSRGIATDEARKLVLAGFLRDSFSQIGIDEVTERLERLID